MTSVAPPPPPPPPQGAGSAVQLTVSANGPAAVQLSQLALDSLINGLVRSSVAGGETTLQTPHGALSFKAAFALPPNANATFKIVQSQPVLQLMLTAINGKPIPPQTPATKVLALGNMTQPQGLTTLNTQATQTSPGNAQPTLQSAQAPATTVSLNNATGLKAVVLNTLNTGQGSSNVPSSTAQTAITTKPTATPAPNATQSAQPQTTGANTTAQTPALQNALQTGNTLNVRLLSVQLPGQAPPETSQASASSPSTSTQVLQGQVQSRNVNGQPIIRMPQGQILLQTNANMPVDTQVKLEVLSFERSPVQNGAAKPTSPRPMPFTNVAQNWDTLQETMSLLKETNPVIADQLSQSILPKPDQRLAVNMIFFLKALGRGQFKNWVDDQTLRTIARAKPDLLSRLEGDFELLSTKAKTPNSTDWKIAYIPIQDQNSLSQIRIAHRQPDEETPDGQEEPGVRFVIDLDLSRLGPMQLDGLAKEKQKKFDLILRTQAPLPGFMRKDIHELFENGMQAIAFDGKLLFQVTPNFVEIEGVDVTQKDLNLGMLV